MDGRAGYEKFNGRLPILEFLDSPSPDRCFLPMAYGSRLRQATAEVVDAVAVVAAAGLEGAARLLQSRSSLPFNGTRMTVIGNGNPTVVAGGGATERRMGVVSVYGGDISWIPVVGNVGSVQFAADGSLVWTETAASGKQREIKTVAVGGQPRTLWKDYDERWFTPTGRDSKVLVSPDGKSVAFVSDRTGWIHIYVIPVNATSESQAKQLTSGSFLNPVIKLMVCRQQEDCLPPQVSPAKSIRTVHQCDSA